MTDQEKRHLRADLLIEIEDAQEEYAHLREKSLRLADGLIEISKKVRGNATLNPSVADFSSDFELANRLRPEHQAVLNFAETVKLIEELKVARQKLFNLTERKAQLSGNGLSVKVPFD